MPLGTTKTPELQDLPTWVGEFSVDLNPRIASQTLYPSVGPPLDAAMRQASREAPIATFSDDFRTLYTRGTVIGSVEILFSVPRDLLDIEEFETPQVWDNWFTQLVPIVERHHIPLKWILDLLREPNSGHHENWDGALAAFKRMFKYAQIKRWMKNIPNLVDTARGFSEVEEVRDLIGMGAPLVLGDTFFLTNTGKIGRCKGSVALGDVAAGIFGINIPFVLGKRGDAFTMISLAAVAGHSYEYFPIEDNTSTTFTIV